MQVTNLSASFVEPRYLVDIRIDHAIQDNFGSSRTITSRTLYNILFSIMTTTCWDGSWRNIIRDNIINNRG